MEIMSKRKQLKKRDRMEIYQKYNARCAYCGVEMHYRDMQVDHLVPLALGGNDFISNMMPSCRPCNHYKSALTLEKFRDCIGRFIQVLERDSATYRNAVRFGQVIPNPAPIVFWFEEMEESNG